MLWHTTLQSKNLSKRLNWPDSANCFSLFVIALCIPSTNFQLKASPLYLIRFVFHFTHLNFTLSVRWTFVNAKNFLSSLNDSTELLTFHKCSVLFRFLCFILTRPLHILVKICATVFVLILHFVVLNSKVICWRSKKKSSPNDLAQTKNFKINIDNQNSAINKALY